MEILILCLAELRELIESNRPSISYLSDGNIRYVCTTDIFYEIELNKKNNAGSPIWRRIKEKTSHFHSAVQKGHVCCVDLDHYAITDGLFEISDDYREIKLWDTAANKHITPEQSARLICLKYLDDSYGYGTSLHKDALTTYYGT